MDVWLVATKKKNIRKTSKNISSSFYTITVLTSTRSKLGLVFIHNLSELNSQ